jgi:hypothetical protein
VLFRERSGILRDHREVMSESDVNGRTRPHAFFWAYLVALGLGLGAALTVPATEAGWALGSKLVHRCEVGLVVGGLSYLVLTAGWLASQGRYLGQLTLPGGSGGGGDSQPVDAAAAQIGDVADDLSEYRKDADARFKSLEDAIDNLANRVQTLEE